MEPENQSEGSPQDPPANEPAVADPAVDPTIAPVTDPVTDPPKDPVKEPTAESVLQKQVADLKTENETIKQKNKEDVQKLLQSVMAPAPVAPVVEPTDDDYLTDPKKAAERSLAAMYEKKIAPQQANTSSRLFGIDYQMVQAGEDAVTFKKLKPDIDKYFTENPQAIDIPNSLQTVFTHFKGVHFNRLHKELVEETAAGEISPPASPTPPGAKSKAPALTEEEKRFAKSIGLTNEEMLESKKEVVG